MSALLSNIRYSLVAKNIAKISVDGQYNVRLGSVAWRHFDSNAAANYYISSVNSSDQDGPSL